MKTLRLRVNPERLDTAEAQDSIRRAAEILRSGGLVAFPTETVYGLGANALEEAAAARIFEAKQRPRWDPLIVHVGDVQTGDGAMLDEVAADLNDRALRLMEQFWPGPLTLLVPKSARIPSMVTAGRARVGVRMPAHAVALALIRAAGLPIAAPSANTFGHVSPTSAEHVLEDLDGRIDAVLDAGECRHGLESTVVDTCESPVVIYRAGVISLEQIAAACGEARMYVEAGELATPDANNSEDAHVAPGLGMRHYAPRARLLLIEGEGAAQRIAFAVAVKEARGRAEQVALMLPDDFLIGHDIVLGTGGQDPGTAGGATGALDPLVYRWGAWDDDAWLAKRLFAGLRELDGAGATVILCPLPPAHGLGIAIRDRLRKAAR